jgi:hypothetical protein
MAKTKKWSAQVAKKSNAMDLKKDVFKQKDPKKIAQSVKKSAEKSPRRKSSPKRSAMSMLSFYVNRAGQKPDRFTKEEIGEGERGTAKTFGIKGGYRVCAEFVAPSGERACR